MAPGVWRFGRNQDVESTIIPLRPRQRGSLKSASSKVPSSCRHRSATRDPDLKRPRNLRCGSHPGNRRSESLARRRRQRNERRSAVPNQPQRRSKPRSRHAGSTTRRGARRWSARNYNAASPRQGGTRPSPLGYARTARTPQSRTGPSAKPAPQNTKHPGQGARPRKMLPPGTAGRAPCFSLEVWPESHWPGFALRETDVFKTYMAWWCM